MSQHNNYSIEHIACRCTLIEFIDSQLKFEMKIKVNKNIIKIRNYRKSNKNMTGCAFQYICAHIKYLCGLI